MTYSQKICAALVLLTGGVFASAPATAQDGPPCGPREQVIAHLTENFAEARVAMALDPRGIVEIWVAQGGSFTVTITTPEGNTCLLSAGQHWTTPAPLATGPAV